MAVEREKPAPRGLEGVVATTTAISSVSDNFLQYRGYRIEELVGKAEYEEVAYLLLNGELPNKDELRDFKAELSKHRPLSPFLRETLQQMSETGTPMDVLRTVISASAVEDPADGARVDPGELGDPLVAHPGQHQRPDRKSTRLNSSHGYQARMPSSA